MVRRPEDLIGTVLGGKYRLTHLIGQGGFGAVYRGWHLLLEVPVAVKVAFRVEGSLGRRFRREARTLMTLRHPQIVRMYDFAEEAGGLVYLVQEFIDGPSLRELLHAGDPLPACFVRQATSQILDALASAHAVGVIHRDVKPANVMVTGYPDAPSIRLLDFGVAKLTSPDPIRAEITQQGGSLGTPAYMAPEQIAGRPVTASDLYALGVSMFQLLTGEKPFPYGAPRVYFAHMKETAPELPGHVPGDLAFVVKKAMAKSLEVRFASALEMKAALWAQQENSKRAYREGDDDDTVRVFRPVILPEAVKRPVVVRGRGQASTVGEVRDARDSSDKTTQSTQPSGQGEPPTGLLAPPDQGEDPRNSQSQAESSAAGLSIGSMATHSSALLETTSPSTWSPGPTDNDGHERGGVDDSPVVVASVDSTSTTSGETHGVVASLNDRRKLEEHHPGRRWLKWAGMGLPLLLASSLAANWLIPEESATSPAHRPIDVRLDPSGAVPRATNRQGAAGFGEQDAGIAVTDSGVGDPDAIKEAGIAIRTVKLKPDSLETDSEDRMLPPQPESTSAKRDVAKSPPARAERSAPTKRTSTRLRAAEPEDSSPEESKGIAQPKAAPRTGQVRPDSTSSRVLKEKAQPDDDQRPDLEPVEDSRVAKSHISLERLASASLAKCECGLAKRYIDALREAGWAVSAKRLDEEHYHTCEVEQCVPN